MKTLKLLIIAMVLSVTCFAQADKDTYTANAADLTAQTFTFLHAEQNTNYGVSHQLEFVWGSAPATTSITSTCVMRGGTTASTLFTSTSTANQTSLVIGLCDLIKTVVSWTGSPSSVKLNITGSVHFAQSSGVAGQVPATGPQLVGGIDGTGVLRPLAVNSTGEPGLVNSFATADGMGNTTGRFAYDTAGVGQNAPLLVYGALFNNASWDRNRSASSSNFPASSTLTARNSIGANLVEKGSRWSVNSAPAAGSQATASIALEAGVKHVLDTVCFSSGSAVVPALTSLQVNVRDGATGAGTVLMSFEVEIPATTGQDTPPICIGGLNLVGTAGTAMTVEWSASLANLKQTATAIGYNVN